MQLCLLLRKRRKEAHVAIKYAASSADFSRVFKALSLHCLVSLRWCTGPLALRDQGSS